MVSPTHLKGFLTQFPPHLGAVTVTFLGRASLASIAMVWKST